MKLSIPASTSNLIGLSEIKTMVDFWSNMDKEYLDYSDRPAIADTKNQENHNMGHHITSDEMVREH